MARFHGSAAVVLLGANDVSNVLNNVTIVPSADLKDDTTFASAGWHSFSGDLLGWDATIDGFHDPASGGIWQQLLALLGTTGAILTVILKAAGAAGAAVVGDKAVVLSDAQLNKVSRPIPVNDLVKVQATLKAAGPVAAEARAGMDGVCLAATQTATASGKLTVVDNTTSTAFGGRFNVHATVIGSGTWEIAFQHSSDNITFVTPSGGVDFIGHTSAFAATGEAVGTINRYICATLVLTGGAGTITLTAAFARYPN